MSRRTTDAIPVRILYESEGARGGGPSQRGVPRHVAIVSHAALAAILVALFLRWEHERLHIVFGCDPAGYLRLTQLICERGFLGTAVDDPEVPKVAAAVKERLPEASIGHLGFFLTPLAFVADEQGRVRCQYPPGFPLVLSVLYRWGGEPAVYYAQPVFLLAGLLIHYVILWRFIHPLTALLGVVVVAGSNWYFAESTLLMADHAGMCLASAALLFALLALDSASLWGWVWAALCGAAFGYGVMVRYQNGLLAVPLLVIAAIGWWRHGPRWALGRTTAALVLVAACGAVPLALYQHSVTGGYFQPTYTVSDLAPGNFGRHYVLLNLAYYVGVMEDRMGLWLVPIGLGVVGMAVVRRTRPLLAVSIAAAVAFGVFHLAIAQKYERYLLVLVPMMAWPAGLALGMFFDGLGWWSGRPRTALVLAVVLAIGYFAVRLEHLDCGISRPLPRSEYDKLADVVPPDGVILCDVETGAIPIYASRRTCRIAWQPARFTDAAIDYWVGTGRPVYCLLDSADSRLRFDELRSRFRRSFESVGGPWRQWSLYTLEVSPGAAHIGRPPPG